MEKRNDPISVAALARSLDKPTDIETWHRRLSHAGLSRIDLMLKKNLVDGLNVTSTSVLGKCVDCLVGKATRRPFDAVVERESRILERVHTDLTGPMRTPARGGF
ncbi:hypothetical protein F5878DRAFT_548102, partial [Lentinula raphanica]